MQMLESKRVRDDERVNDALEKIERLSALLDAFRSFSSTLNLDQVLYRVLSAVEQLVRPERCSIWKLEEETNELRFMVMLGDDPQVKEALKNVHLKAGEGVVGWVVSNGAALNIADVQADQRWSSKVDDTSGFITHSMLCVPLKANDRVIGAVSVLNKKDAPSFDVEDQFILESLSAQIAIAMENALLYAKLNRKNVELQEKLEALELQIAERKRAEDEQRKAEDQLRQMQRIESIGQLAGGIAHDFNNILTPIIGYAEIGRIQMGSPEKLDKSLKQIKDSADRAQALTRQILAFSRKQVLETQALNLNDLVRNFENMMRRLIRADIEIVTNLSPTLGNIRGDYGQIEQIMLNLAVNARDAMSNGGTLTIETADVVLDEAYTRCNPGSKIGPHVMLVVCDTGCGMDEKTMQRIFEPFFTTKERGRGTGLGMATTYGIIKQHNGYIEIQSKPGKGSTFKVYFPLCQEAAVQFEDFTEQGAELHGRETIMVVEDDQSVREIACDILTQFDYRVLHAPGAEKALELAVQRSAPIDLLLTDMIMPRMNGAVLNERMREIFPGLRTLFMSGYPHDALSPLPALNRTTHFLHKPFSVEMLIRKIREILDQD